MNTKTKQIITKVETKEHPLEEFLGIKKGTTEIVTVEQKTELVPHQDYDGKDSEIEEDYQQIFDKAMLGHEILQEQIEETEGKYAARIGEVSAQHLKLALDAAAAKAKLKEHKDKLKAREKAAGPKVQNNTVVVTDTTDLIRMLSGANKPPENLQDVGNVIDVTPVEPNHSTEEE
jgi:hypothetical protein